MSDDKVEQYTSEALDRFISIPSEDYGSFRQMFKNLKVEDMTLPQQEVSETTSSDSIELDAATKIHMFQQARKFRDQNENNKLAKEDTDGMELVADLEVDQGITAFSMDGPGFVQTDNFVEDEDIPTEEAVFYTPSFDNQQSENNSSTQQPSHPPRAETLPTTIPHHQIVEDEDRIRTDADIMLDEINRMQQQGVSVDFPILANRSTDSEDYVLVKNDPLPSGTSIDSGVTEVVAVEAFQLDPDFDYENLPFVPKGLSKEEEQHLARLREEKIIP